ncbi:MDR family MFS transporter [Pandoraea norimbergensis]|uniref:Disulfide bond formation protein DsbA n=1 Tax=Pandoraea norimbergensis TaxID=93219 RepID=A0ABM5WJB0_9BURK|nr:MDR family MFS transporter [Pandoraea norimbergensis]ALS60479.1 MFS transporter [Pandoraea norimbergensis]
MSSNPSTPHSAGQVLPFRQSIVAMLGLCFCTMLVALDQTVVGTALPTIVAELKGFEYYAWVATSYLLTSVITVPIFGRLGDYYGRKPFVIAAIVVFTGASVLCGAANSMPFLVIARALQGIGGGMLVGTAFACIPELFPDPHVRLRWQVMLSSAFGIANAIGPSLGGFLTEAYGWRSVFYVNLPVGLLGLWFVARHLPHMRADDHGKASLDWLGALLIAAALGSLQMLVEWLPADGLSRGVVFLFVAFVVTSLALYWWEQRTSHPIIPFEMFRNPSLAALFVLAVFGGFSMFGVLFYAPLMLQGGFGLSPRETGLLITPMVVCITVGSIANGRLITRLRNPNVMLYGGFLLLAVACAGVITTHRGTPHGLIAFYMLLAGLGLGFVLPNLTVFAQEVAGRAHLGIATALMQSLRMIGGMLGTAIVGTLVGHSYTARVKESLVATGGQQWTAQLTDPQILVNAQAQSDFLATVAHMGQNGALLIEASRTALVGAIHNGQMLSLAAALAGLWFVRRVPLIRLTRGAKPTPPAGE